MAKVCVDAESVELKVPCKPEYVRTIRALVAELADSIPLPQQAIEEVKIAASEAVANIVRHAYAGAPDPAPIVVRCTKSRGTLTIEIIDRGVGFDVPPASDVPSTPDVSKEGGLGIILMRNLMDRVDYWSQPNLGTRIRMTKNRGRGSGVRGQPIAGPID